jgi:hypothetical protein
MDFCAATVSVEQNQTIICIVGDFLANKPGYAVQLFDAMPKHINTSLQALKKINSASMQGIWRRFSASSLN